MSRLLRYAIVLALAVAVGAYIATGPISLDGFLPSHPDREALISQLESAPPAPPASPASFDEELDYMVAKRLATLDGWRAFLGAHANGAYAQAARAEVERRLGVESAPAAAAPPSGPSDHEQGAGIAERLGALASYAQFATTRVERLLLADKAPAPGDAEAFNGASPDARTASGSTAPAPPASSLSDTAPATAAAAISSDALPDAKAANEPVPPAAPATTSAAAGTQFAALTPDEICQRDGDRLARLRSNPSGDEIERFANELGCETLRPQVLALMESLAPAPAVAEASNAAPPVAKPGAEAARPAPPHAGAEVATLKSDETCKRDEDRLARLRLSLSGEEAQRFASELGCEALRPQLQRLMESLGSVAPAPASAGSSLSSDSLLTRVCVGERAALDRLRKEPSAGAAAAFWRDLKCEGLRPQVRLLMESLNLAPEPLGSAAAPGEEGALSEAPAPNGADPVACRTEMAELNRIRAAPDLSDAKRFAGTMTCTALKPQAARLLDSLRE